MRRLSSRIRDDLSGLAGAYGPRIAEIEGYAALSQPASLELAERDLTMIADCLETGDAAPFVKAVEERASAQLASRATAELQMRRLGALESTLMPLVTTVDAAKFLWRLLSDARNVVATVSAEKGKATETQVERSRAALQTIVDSMPFGVVVVGSDKTVRHANNAALEVMGYGAESEILGELCHKTLCPADAGRCPILDLRQQVDRSDRMLVTRDGRRVPILKSVVPITLEGENVLLEAFVETTEFKQAEDELRASRQMLQLIMDNIPQSVFWKDKELVYQGCSQAFADRKGLASPDEIVGKTDFDLSPAEQAERYRRDDQDVIESGIPRLRYEERQVTGDGEERWLETSKIPLRDAEGSVRGVLAMYEDVTDRKAGERERERLYELRTGQVRASVEVSQQLAAVPALDELFRRVVKLVKERFGYYHVQILRHEAELDAVVLVTGYGEPGERMLAAGHTLPMRRGVVGTAAASGESVLVPDVSEDPAWVPNPHLPHTKGELAVPIKLRDDVLGIIDVQSDVVGALDENDLLLLEAISGPIALAIDATTLRQDMEGSLRELRSIQQRATREGWAAFQHEVGLPEGYIYDRLAVSPVEGLWEPEIADAMGSLDVVPPSIKQGDQGTGAGVAPITVQSEPVGVLGVYQDSERPLSSGELELVRMVSEQVAAALENARMAELTQSALAEAQTLYRFGELISGETDVRAIYRAVSKALVDELGYATSYIGILDEEGDALQQVASVGAEETTASRTVSLSEAYDPGVLAVRQRKPVVSNDLASDERFGDMPAEVSAQTRLAAVPVLAEGQVVGVLGVSRLLEETAISDRDVRVLEAVALQVANAIQRARLFEQTEQALAAADAATRRYLRDTWDAFLDGRTLESQVYVAGPEGVTLDEGLWLPEMRRALESGQVVSSVTDPEDTGAEATTHFAVPLRARGQVIGVVNLSWDGTWRQWSERDLELIEGLVEQIGDSIESERQFAQTQATLAETERMYLASQRISAAEQRQEIVQTVLDIVASTAADQALLFVFDQPVSSGLPVSQALAGYWDRTNAPPPAPVGTRYTADEYPLVHLVSRDTPLVVADVMAEDGLAPAVLEALGRFGFRGVAAVPLTVGDEWLGYTVVLTKTLHAFTASEMRLYGSVHDQAATALRSLQLYQEAQRRARREELIREITSKMRGTPDLDTILNTAVQELGKALGVSRAFVRLSTGPDVGEAQAVVEQGDTEPEQAPS